MPCESGVVRDNRPVRALDVDLHSEHVHPRYSGADTVSGAGCGRWSSPRIDLPRHRADTPVELLDLRIWWWGAHLVAAPVARRDVMAKKKRPLRNKLGQFAKKLLAPILPDDPAPVHPVESPMDRDQRDVDQIQHETKAEP